MNVLTLMSILDRNDQPRVSLVRDNGSVYEVIHLEENRFEGKQLRYWFFDDNGELIDTQCAPAPNGEMDLLAEYADDLDTYGCDGQIFKVLWG